MRVRQALFIVDLSDWITDPLKKPLSSKEGVRWEADGRRAARLHDEEEEEEISLEEARQTAERLGLPIPSPLPSASEGEERF